MRKLFAKMWNDDAGIVAFEYLLVATVVGLALVVGLAAVSAAINVELTELATAILALNQSYSIVAQSNCLANSGQTTVVDQVGSVNYGHGVVAPVVSNDTVLTINVCP